MQLSLRVRIDETITQQPQMDSNSTQRITKLATQIGGDYMYRIPLKFLSYVGKLNQPIKTDLKFICSLERLMVKLFESNMNLTNLPAGKPNAKINILRSSLCSAQTTETARFVLSKLPSY